MDLKDIDISRFRFNPLAANIVDILEKEYPEFCEEFGVEKNKAAIYLICFYDLRSPFTERYPDLIEKRKRCAHAAEFPCDKDGRYKKPYEDLMVGDNESFNNASFAYMRSFGSPEYMALYIFWGYLASEYKNASREYNPKTNSESIKNVKLLLTEIKSLTEELFSGKETLNMRIALYSGIEKEIKMLRPETIAEATPEQLEGYLGKPYGNYKPDELKFRE
jgi:hypothetical protein